MNEFTLGEDKRKTSELYALLKRRGFFWPSYEIYGGVAGFFDLGHLGSLLRENVERLWKERFVIQEDFLLVDTPSITPEIAFKWSGHLEKFSDNLTRCLNCSAPFRADHLLEGIVENPDSLKMEELGEALDAQGIKCPVCGGEIGPPEEFNLMFRTFIGPGGERPGYLRPETAQSIFMDFALLYRMNRERMPFGVAQIGKGFRNEISPRQGMMRQREFHMAEGEFFFDPEERTFKPFERYRNLSVNLVPKGSSGETLGITLGSAVEKGLICSEVLAHFMGVTYGFAADVGIPGENMRFRQHTETEMAHYARDCWDLEVETSYGWIEMVGIADRSAYDLRQHMKGSGQSLTAARRFAEPEKRNVTIVEVDQKVLGPIFRGDSRELADIIRGMDPDHLSAIKDNGPPLEIEYSKGKASIPPEAVSIRVEERTVSGEDYIPHIVEPSFGIDRLMVALLEHAYFESDRSPMKEEVDAEQGPYRVLKLRTRVAPIKCGVFPLMNKDELPEIAGRILAECKKAGLTTYYDHSGSIGRRYARMDEIGTPFSITVDYDSKVDLCATIRFRDTGEQVRTPIEGIEEIILDLVSGKRTFDKLGPVI
ncbi:MAG: glycine--tRNA ligase [Thermoplasmatota archaeon]